MPEPHRCAFVRFRSAVGLRFAVHRAVQIAVERPLHVVPHDQIQAPIPVVIHPSGSSAEFVWPGEAGLLRHVRERAVSVVVKQTALAERGHEQVVVAVVIVIAHGHSQAKHLDRQARFSRHIGKRTVMIVVIEMRRGVLFNVARPVHAVHEKNVRPAVVVVINERHTRTHRLGKIFFAEGAVIVNEMNARLLRDVAELNRRACRRGADAGQIRQKQCERAEENRSRRARLGSSFPHGRPTPSASAARLM